MRAFKRQARPLAAALAAGLVLAACSTDGEVAADDEVVEEPVDDETVEEPVEGETEDADDHDMDDMDDLETVAVDISAEQLRATLNRLLQEHVYLAGTATGQALAGNEEAFEAASVALTEGNTEDIADLVGAVYGDDVREQFVGFWNSHIGMFVDYTVATAEDDEAAQDDAVERLLGYTQELADTFETLTDGELPAEASQPGIEMHVTTLKDAVDAQAAGDAELAFTNLREAAHHMDGLAEALANAIATQNGLEGDATSDLAGIQSELNGLLQEHVYLAGTFTGEVLTGGDDVEAAQNALIGGNTEDLADLVAAVYGERTDRDEFVQFWNSHILMFVAYTEGVAADDQDAKDAAVADLVSYGDDLAAAFEELTAGELPADASTPLIVEHVTTLLPAIDAQGEGDFAAAYTELRSAAGHMEMLTFPLFDATVASL
jgi:hypothetical protein